MCKWAAAALAALVFAAGLHWGTFAVGGSDSYCYVQQAHGWASGQLQPVEPLVARVPWPDAAVTFTPTGHVPSPTVSGSIAPICASGLSILMAPFTLGSGGASRGVFLVIPLFGALLIGSTYVIGSRFGGRVGLVSALLVAASPIVLFQLMQPMSDVPATALWALAIACATGSRRSAPLLAGLAASAAILVRPNLLPIGLVVGLFFLMRPGKTMEERLKAARMFALASAPGCLAVGMIQQIFYGSPLRSGYGSAAGLFNTANIRPNAVRYFEWMSQVHTPIWLVGLAAPLLLPGPLTALLFAVVAVTVASYLPYVVFSDWWYLRFMLPGVVLMIVLAVAVIDAVAGRLLAWERARAGVLLGLAFVGCYLFLGEARARSVFDLQRLESRYERAGLYVADRLPENALVFTAWESGSVRYYGHRRTVAWDTLDSAWLDRALEASRTLGFEPYLLFERWEEPGFRQRFTASALGALDWPPMAEIASQVRIYRPEDRQRYLQGQGIETDYAR